ncbi:hypothetical protein CCAX7_007570 [Capsulimonas corticalis]|uniref:Glycoside hydrolase family 127 protein n=1 Tax=Capsulimonas corticalis TaxID=2219043 RepID=A0A9N7QC07_9BACT|nr:beta-L-arabinofuranosidase domain-containing protein [Capsulimonas corticalis]BDI28706.1 hypothetical protein CCAX7_007570 [Capsulimonas corticalis]
MTKPDALIFDTRGGAFPSPQLAPVSAVQLTDAFWAPRLETNRVRTLPTQYLQLEETGCLDNFRRAAGQEGLKFRGWVFADTDLYKWLEAAIWALASGPLPELEARIESAVALIEGAQDTDGYLNTAFMFDRAPERWATINTEGNNHHELYSAGHFFQAAVAHYRATGSERLIAVAKRLADHIAVAIGPGEGQKHGVDAHPEVEMGLVELFRITGERRYLESARYQLDARRGMGRINGAEYPFLPIREYDRLVGHAVCAVYLMAGVADVYAETDEPALGALLERLWANMTQALMYITGGIGPRWDNEAFGADYELPDRAYAETCATVGSIMWSARMLVQEQDAKYADLIELSLYNGFLSGISLDGQSYYYQNVLGDDGTQRRQAWFGCACCPPNMARLFAQLPGYFYSVAPGCVFVNLYASGEAHLTLPADETQEAREVQLIQETNYPWDGRIQITVQSEGKFSIALRLPAWARDVSLSINDEALPNPVAGDYARLTGEWKIGDVIVLDLPMPVRQIVAHPRATSLFGRVALMRGPLVYCFEQEDNPFVDVRDIRITPTSKFTPELDQGLLGGVVALRGDAGVVNEKDWAGALYREASESGEAELEARAVTAIPYYAWANRGAGAMAVWVKRG